MVVSLQIVIDCADPARLAEFWVNALHYQIQNPPTGYQSWEQFLQAQGIPQEDWNKASAIIDPQGIKPRIFFQRVPEQKTGKNRVHIDLNQSQPGTAPEERRQLVDTEVERLKSLGANELYRKEELNEYWVTMTDPEGNEFCVQ
jgi:hypothetical protein